MEPLKLKLTLLEEPIPVPDTGRFYFSVTSMSPRGKGSRSEGYSVRCVAR